MAQAKEKYVTLYAPGGTQVEVNEARAEVLKERGYTTKAPRISPPASRRAAAAGGADQSAELEELRQKLAKAEQERDEALKAATEPKQ